MADFREFIPAAEKWLTFKTARGLTARLLLRRIHPMQADATRERWMRQDRDKERPDPERFVQILADEVLMGWDLTDRGEPYPATHDNKVAWLREQKDVQLFISLNMSLDDPFRGEADAAVASSTSTDPSSSQGGVVAPAATN